MKKVMSELKARSTVYTGMSGCDAEAKMESGEYVWVSYYDASWTYVVAKTSVMDAMDADQEKPEYDEEYTIWTTTGGDVCDGDDPRGSEYAEVFEFLRGIAERLG